MFFVYDILYIILTLCYLPFFLIKRKYHPGFLMRLGIFPESALAKIKAKKVIWLHTVSVGEAQAAASLVKQIKVRHPEFSLVISTVTKTGNKIVQRLIDAQDLAIYSPLDVSLVVKRVIDLLNPQAFIVAETEIWPNLINNLSKRGIPIILVNGRISSGSFRGYSIIRSFLKQVLQRVSLFCMQTEEDAKRIIELGADEHKVKVTGNMKFDLEKPETRNQKPDLKVSEEEKLFIAGSTHRGEEKIILQVYKELIENHPNLRLLIAPRHIERTEEIEKLVSRFGFKPQKISQLTNQRTNEPTILILDTIGQLKSLYACADIVFIGGSLIPHGGQNPIEPAVFAKAIIFGPYMSNFWDMAQVFLKHNAAIMVKDGPQFKNRCLELLNNSALRKELGKRAEEVVEENKGASLRIAELIKEFIQAEGEKK